jgi:predicted DNA-binding mobile mystery protein A
MRLATEQLDRRFVDLRPLVGKAARPPRGWIKAIREGLGMTSAQLAKRMGVSQPRIAELEKAEIGGNVTVQSLERAAEALECRLVYLLIPNQPLEERIAVQAETVAEQHMSSVEQTMRLEKQAVDNDRQRRALKQRIITQLLDRPSRLWQTF